MLSETPVATDDRMWRRWRKEHLEYIARLLPTCEAIPAATLEKLTWLAFTYKPAIVNRMVLEILAEVASIDGLGVLRRGVFL